MEDGGRTVSHWLFVAPEGYTEVECRDSEKRVATVPFYVSGTVTEVALTFQDVVGYLWTQWSTTQVRKQTPITLVLRRKKKAKTRGRRKRQQFG